MLLLLLLLLWLLLLLPFPFLLFRFRLFFFFDPTGVDAAAVVDSFEDEKDVVEAKVVMAEVTVVVEVVVVMARLPVVVAVVAVTAEATAAVDVVGEVAVICDVEVIGVHTVEVAGEVDDDEEDEDDKENGVAFGLNFACFLDFRFVLAASSGLYSATSQK